MTTQSSSPQQVKCESCGKVIAEAATWDEAEEIAEFDFDAHCHRGDEGSGDWTCDECYQKEMAYWASQAPILRAEAVARQHMDAMRDDSLGYYLRMKG